MEKRKNEERRKEETGISLHVSTVILSIVYRLEIFTAKAFFNTAAHTGYPTRLHRWIFTRRENSKRDARKLIDNVGHGREFCCAATRVRGWVEGVERDIFPLVDVCSILPRFLVIEF